jgi:hypothetical protein
MAKHLNLIVDKSFLDKNKNAIFVFGDNTIRQGYGGAAMLRDHPQTYGFITKKFPDNKDSSFYNLKEYTSVFFEELIKLKEKIQEEPFKNFYISQLGGGLANKYKIWDFIIKDGLEINLKNFSNVIFLWNS